MYDRIAVPLDGSRVAAAALPTGRRLAATFGARLALVSVSTHAVERSGGITAVLDEGRRTLAELEGLPSDGGPTDTGSIELVQLDGPDAAAALGRFDGDHPRTLVCMSTTGRGAAHRTLLGSTALAVVRHSPFAVVLVGPRCDPSRTGPVDPIITCLDGSPEAESVLPWVERWARSTGAAIELVRAVYPLGEPGRADPPTAEQIADLGYLDRVARMLAEQGVRCRHETVPHERPVEVVDAAVRSAPDSIVALSTSHPGRMVDLMMGSQAAELVRTAMVPVLVASRRDTVPPPT